MHHILLLVFMPGEFLLAARCCRFELLGAGGFGFGFSLNIFRLFSEMQQVYLETV